MYLQDLYLKLEKLFQAGKEEIFEDGMESEFSKKLVSLIKIYGNEAIEAISCLIVYEKINAEVASEALRWLGHIDHPSSYRFRLWLLEKSLISSSFRIRDGAILGLASLDNPHAIPYLQQAIQKETCIELKEDMEQLLGQLENTRQCHFS